MGIIFGKVSLQVLKAQTDQPLRSLAEVSTQLHLQLRDPKVGPHLGKRRRLERGALVLQWKCC